MESKFSMKTSKIIPQKHIAASRSDMFVGIRGTSFGYFHYDETGDRRVESAYCERFQNRRQGMTKIGR